MSSPISYHRFDVSSADTGIFRDTGPAFNGRILQTRWYPTTADTGAALMMRVMVDPADTGTDIVVCDHANALGTALTRVYLQLVHGPDGSTDPADTGAQVGAPVVSAGSPIRIKVTPGSNGGGVAGRLWVYTG